MAGASDAEDVTRDPLDLLPVDREALASQLGVHAWEP
jgi:hypothetical protein